jgi:hypothetical protein
MTSNNYKSIKWQWPDVGPTPVSYGLDEEIFDSEKFPNAHTFVREAVQNSLDAKPSGSPAPVRVRFAFHSGQIDFQSAFLADLREKKVASGFQWPDEWDDGQITWLTVQDFNTTGLQGDVASRTSDFWNYWLNFGLSNKNGSGRGGRGIGRVTFLIASRINTVIGLTQRSSDCAVHACGMSVLKPIEIDQELKTSYAYLAESTIKNIFKLYEGEEFHSSLASAFNVADQLNTGSYGLALIIPFPHPDLTADRLIAATIENFAPAILEGQLLVELDSTVIDASTISTHASRVRNEFMSAAMRQDPQRLLTLLALVHAQPTVTVTADRAKFHLADITTSEEKETLRSTIDNGENATVEIKIPVTHKSTKSYSKVTAVIGRCETGCKPIDFFYREGMALPEVTARVPADIDLIVLANDGTLVTYLNFCEGKAHLDLLENRDVREKLRENGFSDGVSLKRSVRWLMDDTRALVLPDKSKPDPSVLSGYFAVTRKNAASEKAGAGGAESNNPNAPDPKPNPPVPKPKVRPFYIEDLTDGFSVSANPHFSEFPASFKVRVAYANGERRPKWSPFDFELQKLPFKEFGSRKAITIEKNVLSGVSCGSDFKVEVRGFDTRRELVAILTTEVDSDA